MNFIKKNIILFFALCFAIVFIGVGCSQPDGGGGATLTSVEFQSAVQTGGVDGTSTTTGLTLTFDVDPTTLDATDITVTGATKGDLTGSGFARTLAISNITVANGATVSVAIASPTGYSLSGSPQTAVVYRLPSVVFQSVVQTGGTSGTAYSTALTLTFDDNPTTLDATDIIVTGATKGALNGDGFTRTLAISNITVANGATVSVAIASPTGYSLSGSPKTAVVYRVITPLTFQSAVQSGGTVGSADSTGVTLIFNVDPTTLSADDITVTGATKGALTGSGETRNLAISDLTVQNGETITIVITSPVGFLLTGGTRTVEVYRAPYIGMPYQGGKIAYILQVDDPGYVPGQNHGLIAAISDFSGGQPWTSGGATQTTWIGGTSIDLGTGAANTAAIVGQAGCTGGAAKLCSDYINVDTGTGSYTDWYLPSRSELNKLFDNKLAIGGFDRIYWSSTEYVTEEACHRTFDGFFVGHQKKEKTARVRAVRTF